MRDELISFSLKPSRLMVMLIISIMMAIIVLLYFANINDGIKLVILTIFSLIIILNYWHTSAINEVDYLVELQEMIIRENRVSQLVKVISLNNLGFMALKFTLQVPNKHIRLLIIYYDSVDKATYKRLMRLAKWNH